VNKYPTRKKRKIEEKRLNERERKTTIRYLFCGHNNLLGEQARVRRSQRQVEPHVGAVGQARYHARHSGLGTRKLVVRDERKTK
jgi:hypothetical protein